MFFIQYKVDTYKKVTKMGSQKLHICPIVTKMRSIIGHRIDYKGGGAQTKKMSNKN